MYLGYLVVLRWVRGEVGCMYISLLRGFLIFWLFLSGMRGMYGILIVWCGFLYVLGGLGVLLVLMVIWLMKFVVIICLRVWICVVEGGFSFFLSLKLVCCGMLVFRRFVIWNCSCWIFFRILNCIKWFLY